MSRTRSRRPQAVARRPLSPAEQARLAAMRDELWSRCVELQAIIADKRREAGLSPEPTGPGDPDPYRTPIMLATRG